MDWRHMRRDAGRRPRGLYELKNLCVWNKTNGGMGSVLSLQARAGVRVEDRDGSRTSTTSSSAQNGRHRTNVWDYAGVNTCVRPDRGAGDASDRQAGRAGRGRDEGLLAPRRLGAGSVLRQRHDPDRGRATGRKARALEIDPHYVDVAVRRWQAYTGKSAVLAGSGETFETTEEQRSAKSAAA